MGLKVCPYCGYTLDSFNFTKDHIIPQSFCRQHFSGTGVKNNYFNIIEVCYSCNRSKSNDIWIPHYSPDGWMRNLSEEFIEGHSRLFFEVLKARKNEVKLWIYMKNIVSHASRVISYQEAEPAIDKDLENFLLHYIWNTKYKNWKLRSIY